MRAKPLSLDNQVKAIKARHGKYCECFLCTEPEAPQPISNVPTPSITCERCRLNPATAEWACISKNGHERRMNLCPSCGFSVPTWIRQFTPTDEEGQAIPGQDPVFYKPYVRAQIRGKPVKMASNRARMPYKQRSPQYPTDTLDAMLEGFGVTVPEAVRTKPTQ